MENIGLNQKTTIYTTITILLLAGTIFALTDYIETNETVSQQSNASLDYKVLNIGSLRVGRGTVFDVQEEVNGTVFPVENVSVMVGGEIVGTTNERGRLNHTWEKNGNRTVKFIDNGSSLEKTFNVRNPLTDYNSSSDMLSGELDVFVLGSQSVGGELRFEVVRNNTLIQGAEISKGDEVIGVSGENGCINYTLESPDNQTFTITHRDDTVSKTIDVFGSSDNIESINLDAPGSVGQGGNFTVFVTDESDTLLEGVEIIVDGNSVGETGSEGGLNVSMPKDKASVVVEARYNSLSDSQTVQLSADWGLNVNSPVQSGNNVQVFAPNGAEIVLR